MNGLNKLNTVNLNYLPVMVKVPSYDRTKVKTGIVHIGVGNFHRAHQAFYTDELLQGGDTDWGICGIGLLDNDAKICKALEEQDGLYTLMNYEPNGTIKTQVVGAIKEVIHAPVNSRRALNKLADQEVKIISMTITEGGYNFDSSTGEFLFFEPGIQWDLKHPGTPKTVFGFLTRGLKLRKEKGLEGVTILSCDNLQHNGDVCRKMLTSYIKEAEPSLHSWVEDQCTFPNSMVDRITPVTTKEDIDNLREKIGVEDQWPVPCEPFIQWIIEDNFSAGRPEWEKAGAQFVKDVTPYEKMKIRLLNAGHSLLGFSGTLSGYDAIDETVSDSIIQKYLRGFMDDEVTPVLGKVEGIDLNEYKNSLVHRFSNPAIKDKLSRICGESSAKIPKFLLPTINEQLERGGPIEYGAMIIATWYRYLELAGSPGFEYGVQDDMKDMLLYAVRNSPVNDPSSFIKIVPLFGDLARSERFTNTFLKHVERLQQSGIKETIKRLLNDD